MRVPYLKYLALDLSRDFWFFFSESGIYAYMRECFGMGPKNEPEVYLYFIYISHTAWCLFYNMLIVFWPACLIRSSVGLYISDFYAHAEKVLDSGAIGDVPPGDTLWTKVTHDPESSTMWTKLRRADSLGDFKFGNLIFGLKSEFMYLKWALCSWIQSIHHWEKTWPFCVNSNVFNVTWTQHSCHRLTNNSMSPWTWSFFFPIDVSLFTLSISYIPSSSQKII